MDIKDLNKLAVQLLEGKEICKLSSLPTSKSELEAIIKMQSEWQETDKKISFLPLHRLNSRDERQKGLEVIKQVIETGQFTSGVYVDEIEANLSHLYQAGCIATSSGTDALKIALKSIGVGPGDEVILPLNSFAATENAVFSVGAIPVFANIDNSHNIDFNTIQELVTNRTKAIIAVCLYGSSRNIMETYSIAKKNGLKMIVDAAQCYGIKEILDYADILALSFNPFKNIGTFGKSGALITKNHKIEHFARMYSYHGFLNKRKNVKGINWGYNSRMDNMQAAILKEKLKTFEINSLKRCYIAQRYIKELQVLEDKGLLLLPIEKKSNTWHLFPLVLHEEKREDIISFARTKNIEFDIYYPILAHQFDTEYANKYPRKYSFLVSETLHNKTLHIPLHSHMSLEEQNQIIQLIYEYFKQ